MWLGFLLFFSLAFGAENGAHVPGVPEHATIDFLSRCRFTKSSHPDARKRPVLIAIPGGPGLSSESFATPARLSDQMDVCLLDPPGTGLAQALTDPTYESVLEDIEKAIKALNRDVVLAGHSFGGIIAGDLAVRGKLPIKSLVFVGAPLSEKSLHAAEVTRANFAKEHPAVQKIGERLHEKGEDKELKEYFAATGDLYFTEPHRKAGLKMLDESKVSGKLVSTYEGAKPRLAGMLEKLKAVKVPMLEIAGTGDLVVPLKDIKDDANIAQIPVKEIPGVNHFVAFEEPEKVNAAILETAQKAFPK